MTEQNEYNELERLLLQMIQLGASDIHLNHRAKISFRIDGEIHQIGPYIKGDQIFQLALYALGAEEQRTLHMKKSIDFSYAFSVYRFRGSLIMQRGEYSCVFRRINDTIVPLDALGLPSLPVLKQLLDLSWGMILVTGPTGSGKSTTLASIVDYINTNKPLHIATIEQPLEFIHQNKKSIVTQREVGKDTPTFQESMKDVLRQDPDVILVGEMRDYDTVSSAVTNAETGHLVLGTLHTNTSALTINRILDFYPEGVQRSVRGQLASNLRGVINQRLFPKPGGGRTAIYEFMVVDDEISELIRQGKPHLIHGVMEQKKDCGNVLMSDSIEEARAKGLIHSHVKW